MPVLATKTVNDQLVYYDYAYPNRWLDAFGPSVVKFLEEGFYPLQAANQPAWGTATLVNASTVAAVGGAQGAQFIITTAGADCENMPGRSANGDVKSLTCKPSSMDAASATCKAVGQGGICQKGPFDERTYKAPVKSATASTYRSPSSRSPAAGRALSRAWNSQVLAHFL